MYVSELQPLLKRPYARKTYHNQPLPRLMQERALLAYVKIATAQRCLLRAHLMLNMPVNGNDFERTDDDWYVNIGVGLQIESDDKISTGGLRNTMTAGMRLSPTLVIEMP